MSFDPGDFNDLADMAGMLQRQEMLNRMQNTRASRTEGPPPEDRQCPLCGGRLAGEFKKCQKCGSDITWVGGMPCEPGKEEELRDRQRKEAINHFIWNSVQNSMTPVQIAHALSESFPQEMGTLAKQGNTLDAEGVREWIESQRGIRFCRTCGVAILPKSPRGRCGKCNTPKPQGCVLLLAALAGMSVFGVVSVLVIW